MKKRMLFAALCLGLCLALCACGGKQEKKAVAYKDGTYTGQSEVYEGDEEGNGDGYGVATLTISYYDLGYATGEMAYEVLVNGADVSVMPIQKAPKLVKEYNAELCELLGVEIPEDYVAIAE